MSASAKGERDCPGKQIRQEAGLNRSILDAPFGEFARQLAYKAEWYRRTLVKVDRFYPSSKTCSGCGHRLASLPLAVREWRCPACGAEHDRDHNAARNIEREGLRQFQHPEKNGEVRAFGGGGLAPWPCQRESFETPAPVGNLGDGTHGEFRSTPEANLQQKLAKVPAACSALLA